MAPKKVVEDIILQDEVPKTKMYKYTKINSYEEMYILYKYYIHTNIVTYAYTRVYIYIYIHTYTVYMRIYYI